MRIHVGRAVGRLVLVTASLLGALVATRGVHPERLDAATHAACASHLPGTAARCSSDHAAAQLLPYVLPALVGIVVGLAVAVIVLGVLRLLGGAGRTTSVPAAAVSAPSWLVLPMREDGRSGPTRASQEARRTGSGALPRR